MNCEKTSLNLKHAILLLSKLKEKGKSNMTDLRSKDIITNYRTLRNLVDELEKDSFINKRVVQEDRLSYEISLTEKGEKLVNFLEDL